MDDQLATQLASAMTGTTPASAFHTDAAATTATFTVTEKFGLMTAHGTIPVVTADVTVDADGLPRGTATLDVSALDTGNARRDKDLRGARFFDTATFPLVDFRSASVPAAPTTASWSTGSSRSVARTARSAWRRPSRTSRTAVSRCTRPGRSTG